MLEGIDWSALKINQLPKLCEWTRIEISHVEDEWETFITFSVGDKEVGRTEAADISREFENLEDVKIHTGSFHADYFQPGFVRGLFVLEKQYEF